ncbi:MAG: 23S rRNA (adenine(2503)-C(2))-methyltransferase RlmN [Bacteroidales bacterium]|jgi:23S rRNA (adenine2503-C2)-methyltransferase|nr:23S rRNA (adenine(2503)-C(2))-methyltransferase RlmN [Bacteroidales bacterium]
MDNKRKNIRNQEYSELMDFFNDLNEKKFRLTQLSEWLWKKGSESFQEMKNLPQSLKEKLEQQYYIDKIKPVFQTSGKDKTTKFLFQSVDDHKFEGVLIPDKDRVTACISTQIGCQLNCSFCATGKIGYKRNLTTGEIFDEVFLLNKLSNDIFAKNLSNIVIMGMGEPLLNYGNTINAINIIMSENGMGMSPQRITLSTAGVVPGIKKLADDNIKFNLSISLHSADNEKRSTIMPVNKKYDLEALKKAIKYFYEKTGTRVTYEYLMLGGINDSIEDAVKLTEFTKISPCKINLIQYNSTEKSEYKNTSKEKLQDFFNFLENKNLIVTLRKSKGQDINAACGQLANKNNIL